MSEVMPPPPNIPEGLEHLLPQFVAEMLKDSATLSGLLGGSLEEMGEHAHAMRGKAGLFGEDHLYDLLSRLERMAMDGCTEGMADLCAQVIERSNQLAVYGQLPAAGQS